MNFTSMKIRTLVVGAALMLSAAAAIAVPMGPDPNPYGNLVGKIPMGPDPNPYGNLVGKIPMGPDPNPYGNLVG